MSYDSDLAALLQRMGRKEPPAGYYIGPVVSLSPLTICDCGGNCDHPCFPPPLKVGDQMIVVGQRTFCAIDRLGG